MAKYVIVKHLSLNDISKSLNISKSTISLVLNGRGDEKRVSKDTQEKIIKFAKEHNYNPNQLARALSRGKSDMIGLIVPNISDVFFATIARRIEKKAEQSGYSVIFSSTGESIEREVKMIQSMLDRQVDGLIITSCQMNDKGILGLKKDNFPFVLIDRVYPEIETNFVGFDNNEGIASATELLINSGRKRIGFVSITTVLETLRERSASYLQTMEKHGLQVEEGFIQEVVRDCVETDIYNAIRALVQDPIGIEAIVFATHYLAAEGLRALKSMQIRVPDDVAVVSYGERRDFDLLEPALTSVRLPVHEMGDKAVDILLKNMKETTSTYETVRLSTELIIRKSCGAL